MEIFRIIQNFFLRNLHLEVKIKLIKKLILFFIKNVYYFFNFEIVLRKFLKNFILFMLAYD